VTPVFGIAQSPGLGGWDAKKTALDGRSCESVSVARGSAPNRGTAAGISELFESVLHTKY
jgi:hypothetical protein